MPIPGIKLSTCLTLASLPGGACSVGGWTAFAQTPAFDIFINLQCLTQGDTNSYQVGMDTAHQYGQYGSGLQGGGCDSLHHTHAPVFAQGTMLNSSTDAIGLIPCIG